MNTVNTAAKRLLLVIFVCGIYVLLMNGESVSALYGEIEPENVYVEDYLYVGNKYTSDDIVDGIDELSYYDLEGCTWSIDNDIVKIYYDSYGTFTIVALKSGEVTVRGVHNAPDRPLKNGSIVEIKLTVENVPTPKVRKQTDLKYCALDSDSIEVGIDIPDDIHLNYDVLLYRSTKKKGGYKLVKRKQIGRAHV